MDWHEYKGKLNKDYSDKDLVLLERAFNFASEVHKNEKRMTGESYINHPAAVSLKVADLNIGPQAMAAALLHDTYESNPPILKKIQKEFGSEIAFLVKGMSKVDKIEYRGIERSAESTRRMFMAMAEDLRVIIIKLLDRLHNLETLYVLPVEKQKRIALETLEIYAPVADRLGMGEIKFRLEDAAFKYAHPEEYEWILKETKDKIPERENYLKKKVLPILARELKQEGVEIKSMIYRAKHYYSLWKKLLRNNMDWYMIYDLTAVRIVVESIEDCYRVLGIIHKLWKPLPGRIKDYISLPKQNGYQSLHTTVFCEDKRTTEFQIRTLKMHQEAEQGIAAHWAWEMAGKPRETKSMPHKKFLWIKQLQEWHKKFHKNEGGGKFLESLKIDFFKDRIFALTPKGDIIDLPEGASIVDFAYHIHSDLGDSITGAKVNNRLVSFSHELQSGDMVEILTQKNKKPTLKMLEYAKTSLAQNHIKSNFKKGFVEKIFEKKNQFKMELKIVVSDRIGMIKDIGTVLSSFKINVQSFVTKETDAKYAVITASFLIKNREQAEKIVIRLKNIKGVEEINYKIK